MRLCVQLASASISTVLGSANYVSKLMWHMLPGAVFLDFSVSRDERWAQGEQTAAPHPMRPASRLYADETWHAAGLCVAGKDAWVCLGKITSLNAARCCPCCFRGSSPSILRFSRLVWEPLWDLRTSLRMLAKLLTCISAFISIETIKIFLV